MLMHVLRRSDQNGAPSTLVDVQRLSGGIVTLYMTMAQRTPCHSQAALALTNYVVFAGG